MVWVLVGEDLNIPTVFQIHVNDVLLDFINHFVFVYFDNILIFSKLPQEHESHVKQVLCIKKVLQSFSNSMAPLVTHCP